MRMDSLALFFFVSSSTAASLEALFADQSNTVCFPTEVVKYRFSSMDSLDRDAVGFAIPDDRDSNNFIVDVH